MQSSLHLTNSKSLNSLEFLGVEVDCDAQVAIYQLLRAPDVGCHSHTGGKVQVSPHLLEESLHNLISSLLQLVS